MNNKEKGLRNVRILTTSAMLAALSIVIGIFCKNFLNFSQGFFRITFENFPIILSGIMFGPAIGAAVGIVSDVLSFFLSTQSFAISPIVTLGAALVGAVSGVMSHYVLKGKGNTRIVLSVVAAHFIGSVLVKTLGIYQYYHTSYWIMLLWRIGIYAVIASIEALLICLIAKHKAFEKHMR
ncbi:MAG: folate family ECF transporter S component [Eubacteriales bacterium]